MHRHRAFVFCFLLSAFVATGPAAAVTTSFQYVDFSSTDGLNLVGDAAAVNGRLLITPAVGSQAGAVWHADRVDIAAGFESTFTYVIEDLRSHNTGSDGFAFVIQNASANEITAGGGLIGYAGGRHQVAIEFDTHETIELHDPNDNHVAIHSQGSNPNSSDHDTALAWTTPPFNINDTVMRQIKVVYMPNALRIVADGQELLSAPIDVESLIGTHDGRAWIGFTAGTGGGWQSHQVRNWSYGPVAEPFEPLVLWGSPWKYLDDGSDQGSAWKEPAYPDQSWRQGPAPLGYGEEFIATEVRFGPNNDNALNDPDSKYTTTYLRHSFQYDGDPDTLRELGLSFRRDDAVAIYLNGAEVARDNLDENATFNTFADDPAEDDGDALLYERVDPQLLVHGTNILAAEVHQASLTSSDLVFDLQLLAVPVSDPEFGAVTPNIATAFDEPSLGAAAYSRGGNPSAVELEFTGDAGPGVADFAGNRGYHLNAGLLHLETELIDTRNFTDVQVAIDARTWETSDGTDFETEDFLRAAVLVSADGQRFDELTLITERTGGESVGDLNDELKELDNGPLGEFITFSIDVPDDVAALRIAVDARFTSGSEHLALDNIAVTGTLVPEPATMLLALICLIAAGLVRTRAPWGTFPNAPKALA